MDISKSVRKIDRWQQKHRAVSFVYALFKKYGDDSGGYQAALLTYYAFLSIFPLMLVLVTVLQIWFRGDTVFQHQVSANIGHFFPLLGDQLQHNIHGLGGAGFGLVVGIVVTIYGSRGAADAFRYTIDNMWQIPKNKRAGFPKNLLHSFAIMCAALGGFAATLAVSIFTTDLGHATWVKVLANVGGFCILTAVFGYAFRIATLGRLRLRYMLLGAMIAAVLIQLLLSFGGIVVAHELHKLDSSYGTFAFVLGLLFWIYLISQVVLLAAEVDTVRHFRLWPRSISGGPLQTDADRTAYDLYAQTDKYVPNETIKTKFRRVG
ncbi:MAG TPA: YihY/virulence factor BrkB family protein [Candidatus Saccharimonadales bacterium]|nr:YihY/virulence factor BrkB family protein [Candidatus Saccharimonadales bacterium]